MSKVLTAKRADIAALFVNKETGAAPFPVSYDREEFSPFHLIGPMPSDFFNIQTEMIERDLAEKDNTNLQIIPYVVLVNQEENRIFVYKRGTASNEDRLIDKCSIGLGGHIDIAPNSWQNLVQVIAKEALRELKEEVGYEASDVETENILEGFMQASSIIFTEADEVGTVHLGVSLLLNVKPERLGQLENNVIESGKWLTFDEIAKAVADKEFQLEAWSELVMMHIQSINQNRNANPVANALNEQMGNVHNAFNKFFHLKSVMSVEDAVPAWDKFTAALQELNAELDAIMAVKMPAVPVEVAAANDGGEPAPTVH